MSAVLSKRPVGVGEMLVSDAPDDVLITYALGSCLGVAVVDREAGVGGLLHCQLPMAREDDARAHSRPAMFVDTGVPALFDALVRLGAQKRRMVVKVAGGAQIMDDNNHFKIGERNYTVLRKLLWKNNLLIQAADVGGSHPRTMSLGVGTGVVLLQSAGREWEL